MKVHPANVVAINGLLAKAERDAVYKTTAEDLFKLLRGVHSHLPVRLGGLRGTILQTVLTPTRINQGHSLPSGEVTWFRLMHDGKTWVLEEVRRSARGRSFSFYRPRLSMRSQQSMCAQIWD